MKFNPWRLVWAVISASLFGAGGTFLHAQTADTIKTIEKAWKSRQERIRAVRIKWTEKHTVPKGHVTDVMGAMPDGAERLEQMGIARGATIPPQDVTFDITAIFSFEGEKVRLDYDDKQWSAQENMYVSQPEVTLYDGKERKRYLRQGTSYTPWPFGSRQAGHPFRNSIILSPLVMTCCPLHKEMRLIDIHTLALTGRRVIADGRPCLQLQHQKANSNQLILVDPTRDFVITRILRTMNERTLYNIDINYEKDESGEWMPISWERGSFWPNGKLKRSTKAKVMATEINPAANAEAYNLEFPVGTLVRDETDREHLRRYIVREGNNKRMISSSESGLTYDQLLNSEPGGIFGKIGSAFSNMSFWAAALAIISGGWLLWRRRYRRKLN